MKIIVLSGWRSGGQEVVLEGRSGGQEVVLEGRSGGQEVVLEGRSGLMYSFERRWEGWWWWWCL